jgi:hypothetical protein
MGSAGSAIAKARIDSLFYEFTKWGRAEMQSFQHRSQQVLGNTFALRRNEFAFLINKDLFTIKALNDLFSKVFDSRGNAIVDKMGVICAICLLSKLSNVEKVEFLFEIFNFDNKGNNLCAVIFRYVLLHIYLVLNNRLSIRARNFSFILFVDKWSVSSGFKY